MDKVEMFGKIAHSLVPKAELVLDGIDEAVPQPLEGLAGAAARSLDAMDEFILMKEADDRQCRAYMEEVLKLATIAMSGHLYILGEASSASRVADQMADTYRRKNADYGDSFGASLDKYGPVAAHVRMSDKVNRLQSLVVRKQTARVKDESIADTFLDLACYAIMRLVYIEVKAKELDEETEAADE